MKSTRRQIVDLIEQGAIDERQLAKALVATGMTPSGGEWRAFIQRMLLWLGSLAVVFAVMFFIAFNWTELGRFAKFALVQLALAAAIAGYVWRDGTLAGQAALVGAVVLLGVLLALFGQTYQTGADPWQLFFSWAVLMLPWAVTGRLPVLWLIWLGLLNVSVILYFRTFDRFGVFFGAESALSWLLFLLNTVAWLVWEALVPAFRWLNTRWAVRLIAVASGVAITQLALFWAVDGSLGHPVAILVWLVWLAALYGVYRHLKPDLFVLAGGCLSAMVVVIALVARHILDFDEAGGFLLLCMLVIGIGAGAAVWLKQIAREVNP